MPLQMLLDWTIPSGLPARSVLHFDSGKDAQAVADAIAAAFTVDFLSNFNNAVRVQVDPNWKLLDDATGAMTASGTIQPHAPQGGGNGTAAMADASQALVRIVTSSIRNGRHVQGRVFLPGVAVGNLVNGNLTASSALSLSAPFNSLCDVATSLGVWSRPKPGTPGAFVKGNGANGNTEVAVLRRRRNK